MQNANLPHGILAGRLRACSVEAYAALHDGVWDVEVLQLTTGVVDAGAEFVATPSAVIYQEHWNRPVHARGALRADQVAFGLPARQDAAYRVAGRAAEADSLHRLVQSSELDMVTGAPYRNLVLVVGRQRLERALEASAPALVPSVLEGASSTILRIGVRAQRKLLSRLTGLAEALLGGALPVGWTATRVEDEIVDALVEALLEISDSTCSPIVGRRRLTWDAIAWAQQNDFDVTMGALCENTGRSRRALELAFRQVVGLSPARYFRQARLEGAFRDLAHASSEQTTVTRVAMRWGFVELGRFAGTYRSWFGELPSQTLARPPLHSPGLPRLRSPARGMAPTR